MINYLVKRLVYLLVVLFCISIFVFTVMSAVNGGIVFPEADNEAVFLDRYFSWLRAIFISPPKESYWPRLAVFSYFGKMLPATLALAGYSLCIIILLSLPIGMLAAFKTNSIFDYSIRICSYLGASIPNFAFGLLLIFTFVVGLDWFPIMAQRGFRGMVLPVCTLTIPLISRFLRLIRASTLEELKQDYVVGASARGIGQWRIATLHILPNIIHSIFGYLLISVGHLLNGVVVIETVFILQGVGTIVVSSIRVRDYPVIQSYVLWMALIYVISSFIIDILSHIIEPKSRRRGTYNA